MVKFTHNTENKYRELQSRIIQIVAKTSASVHTRLPLRQATVGSSEPTLNTTTGSQDVAAPAIQRRETEPQINQSNSQRVSVHFHWPHGSQLPAVTEPEEYGDLDHGGSGSSHPSAAVDRNLRTSQQTEYQFPKPAHGKLKSLAGNVTGATNAVDGGDFSRLAMFDTVFIIDDTSSMQFAVNSNDKSDPPLSRWSVLENCLQYIAEIAIKHDKDGVDIQFLKMTELNGNDITDPTVIFEKLEKVRKHLDQPKCAGGTVFYDALDEAIEPRLENYREYVKAKAAKLRPQRPKPMNLIVLTDGEADDNQEVRWYLAGVGVELTDMRAPPRQIGIQFVQIGDDEKSALWLEEMDDRLKTEDGKVVRDVST